VCTGTGATHRYRIVRPDGSIRHVESIGATESADQSISGILLDVTAEVEAEQRGGAMQRRLRDIVSVQQAYAKIGGLLETVVMSEIPESALLVGFPVRGATARGSRRQESIR
jgi:hypothetical protein